MTPKNGWFPMDSAPRTGERITLYIAGRGAFEGWWHKTWLHDEQYWMDDQDSEPDPVAWRPLLPGPFEDHIIEPRGCPIPGACSCPNIAEAA